tara:strand:- start:21 stop:452 length:432 start_codon:yes stop_codon:yes gene_type:complete
MANGYHIAREIDRINFWSYVRHLKAYDLMTIHASILWDDYPPFQSFLYFLYERCNFESSRRWSTADFLKKLTIFHAERTRKSTSHFVIQQVDPIFVVRGDDPYVGINEFMDNFLRTRFAVVYGKDELQGIHEKTQTGPLALMD